MEKYRFDLQLFAEEAPAQAQPEATEQPEGQEPAQEQGAGDKKYTDKDVDAIINKKFTVVYNYMRDTWGIDLNELRKIVLRRQQEITEIDLSTIQ